ncbi:hypothetical protein DFR31_0028 [Alkalispirillum mobile]|uniref:Uncharacterized protein n=1 Tax=Alkalispirillum mobile TaxID=85925 RepID=A0A498C584_9GAMM|nr:hypothetical protein [Alkalispirillum mobile]RLK50139.1 hypothetical protein DFR31_0028 [Alkalispirillum mobile]
MRTLTAVILAALFTVAYVILLYATINWLWPLFPPWLKLVGFILLAVFAIGSPIFALARLARHHPEAGERLVRLLGGRAPERAETPNERDRHSPDNDTR